MPFYLSTQYRDMAAIWPWIALATIGVTLGTVVGGRVLGRIPEVWFRRVLALLLALLGLPMVIRAIDPGESGATARVVVLVCRHPTEARCVDIAVLRHVAAKATNTPLRRPTN
jgi:hypothetical protein